MKVQAKFVEDQWRVVVVAVGPRGDRLTLDERVTLMTLWAIARSPLMIGSDLPSSDPATVADADADVLAVHAASSGNREVLREGPLILWAADGPAGGRFAAAFNLGVPKRPSRCPD